MTGHPLRATLLLALLIGCFALPLHWVTRERSLPSRTDHTAESREAGSTTGTPCDIVIRAAHPFSRLTLTLPSGDQELTPEQDSLTTHLPLSQGPVTMTVSAEWPTGTPETALLIRIEPEGLEARQQTLWGIESAYDTLTFEWKGADDGN